jgi:hypothetical protein
MHKVYNNEKKELLLVNLKTKLYKNANINTLQELLKPSLVKENNYIAVYHIFSEAAKNDINGYCLWVLNKNDVEDQLLFTLSKNNNTPLFDKSIILNNNQIIIDNLNYYIDTDNKFKLFQNNIEN